VSAVLAAAALLVPCTAADSGTAEIRGRVRDATARAAVGQAVVEVRGDGTLRRTRTDRSGTYRIRGLPAGWLSVTVRHQGYRESRVRVRVSPGQCLDVDFTVELDPVRMPALRVAGLPAGRRVEAPEVGGGDLLDAAVGPGAPALEALRATPLGGSGLGTAVRRSIRPEPADPSVLYLRGTTAPFKQVLLDGAPVQTPFHLAGLLASHPRGVLGSSRLRSGGPAPRFGGGLLYTLDLKTRAPAGETRASGSVDLLGASARASGPLGDGGYLASGRTLHPGRELGGGRSLEARRYSDGLVRLSAGGERGLGGSVTGFWNRASTPLAAEEGDPMEAVWGNAAGSARLRTGSRTEGWRATLAASRYRSELPLRDSAGRDAGEEVSASVAEQRVVIRRRDRRGDVEWTAGGAFRRKGQRLGVSGGAASGVGSGSGAARRIGGFASARWHVSPELSLRGGLRTDHFSPDGSVRVAPRAAAVLRVGPETSVRLSAGRVHQLLAGWRRVDGAVDDVAGSPASRVPEPRVAGGDRLELRLEHRGGSGLRIGGEGHFRRIEGVSPTALFDTVGADSVGVFQPMEETSSAGGVYSSGLELWGSWRGSDVALWANYSLSWLWGSPDASGVSRRFAARQVLSGGGEASLPAGFRVRTSLAGSWGLPMTPLPVTGGESGPASLPQSASNGVDDPAGGVDRREGSPYLRLDARVERGFETTLFGTRTRVTPYARLINALGRENSLFHRVPAAGGGLQPVNPVPMLPVVGVSFRAPAGSWTGTR